jgi:hypothetical protein
MTLREFMESRTPRVPKDCTIPRNTFALYLSDEELMHFIDDFQEDEFVLREIVRELVIRNNEL